MGGCYLPGVRTPILLYLVALAVRGGLIAAFPDPAYPDSSYYVDVARSLAAGHGFTTDVIWIFAEVGNRLPANPTLPIPSNGHWLPLASLVQVPFIWLLGPTAFASTLPSALLGSLAAPLTWLIARDAGSRPTVALGAGLLAAAPAAGAVFMAQPENLAILLPLVAATLWMVGRGLKGSGRSFALAGLLAGLAALARNDGVLLAGAIGLIWLGDRIRWLRRRSGSRAWVVAEVRPPIAIWAAVAAAMLFLLAIGPWWARQLTVFGSISPTAASGAALWIRSIDEWDSITAQPSLDRFLAQGLGTILASRLLGLGQALLIFSVVACSLVLVPPLLVGIVARRRSPDFVPWLAYAPVVVLGAALLYPAHIPGGALVHSAIGLVPHTYILALEGVAALAGALALGRGRARASGPTGDGAGLVGPGGGDGGGTAGGRDGLPIRLFVGVAVAFTLGTAFLYAGPVIAGWDRVRAPRVALAAELDQRGVPADDRIMSLDAAGLKYWTGRPGVVTPNDPIDTIQAVARAYGIRWLVLEAGPAESDGPVAALRPILRGETRPSWVGAAAWSYGVGPAGGATGGTAGGTRALVLFPVCTTIADTRCAP